MVDKEMIATSTAIEEAVLRMDVRTGADESVQPSEDTQALTSPCLFHRRFWTRQRKKLLVLNWRSTRSKSNNSASQRLFSAVSCCLTSSMCVCSVWTQHPGILFRPDEGETFFLYSHDYFRLVYPDRLSPPQAVHMLVTAATDLQKDIVEGGRVSFSSFGPQKSLTTVQSKNNLFNKHWLS